MTIRVVTYNDVTDTCNVAELVPYPDIVSGDTTNVSVSTNPATGKVTFTIDANIDLCEMIGDFATSAAKIGG
jgi:hypothetical protein